VEFEWDPAKSAATEQSRGIGFARAAEVFTGRTVEWADNRHPYGEARVRVVGTSAGELLHVVYDQTGHRNPHHLGPLSQQTGARSVALIRMTLEDVKAQAAARPPKEQAAFQRRMAATAEADIHRQMIEDGEDPQTEPRFASPVLAQDVRKKLRLTQAAIAGLLGIPVATLRNWEQNRFVMEPAAQTLLKVIDREPEAALRALRGPQAA